MAFSDKSMYPGTLLYTATVGLTGAASSISAAASGARKINHILVSVNGATARLLTFRAAGAGATFFSIVAPANNTIVIPGWTTDPTLGLEAFVGAGTDLSMTVFFYKP